MEFIRVYAADGLAIQASAATNSIFGTVTQPSAEPARHVSE